MQQEEIRRYVGEVADALTKRGWTVTDRFSEPVEPADYTIQVAVHGGLVVDLIYDTLSWQAIVYPYGGTGQGHLMTDRADARPEQVVVMFDGFLKGARRRWPVRAAGAAGPWWQHSVEQWRRGYSDGITGEVWTMAAGLYTGGIRRPDGTAVVLGENFGHPGGLSRAQAAVDALHARQERRYEITWTVTEQHRVTLTEGQIREIFAVRAGAPIDRAALDPADGTDPLGGIEGDEYNTYDRAVGRSLTDLREVPAARTFTAATVPIGTVLASGAKVTGREVEAGGFVSLDFDLNGVDYVEVHPGDEVLVEAGAR